MRMARPASSVGAFLAKAATCPLQSSAPSPRAWRSPRGPQCYPPSARRSSRPCPPRSAPPSARARWRSMRRSRRSSWASPRSSWRRGLRGCPWASGTPRPSTLRPGARAGSSTQPCWREGWTRSGVGLAARARRRSPGAWRAPRPSATAWWRRSSPSQSKRRGRGESMLTWASIPRCWRVASGSSCIRSQCWGWGSGLGRRSERGGQPHRHAGAPWSLLRRELHVNRAVLFYSPPAAFTG
mmetsp:Transcript_9475/g.31084  ORF Transcript_9475/g.31084 Transcript_9475/m.31084 type:complete len:240 (+) Transcript_9475:685-1404(+)